jgi:hypothetical protein
VPAVRGSLERSCSSVYSSNKELLIVLIQANPSTSLRAAQIVQHIFKNDCLSLSETIRIDLVQIKKKKCPGKAQEVLSSKIKQLFHCINRNS